jgi:prepilin-type N-terminal cleavage/methylation domain-containing protein
MSNKTGTQRSGFTLVEVLASMAVLAVLILMLGGFFDQATKAWNSGETQVVVFDMARGALDEVYRDTTMAVADRYLPFAVQNDYAIVWDQGASPRPQGTGARINGFGSSLPIGGADAVRMLTAVGARGDGSTISDIYDVMYYLAYDENTGKGQLKRRGKPIHGIGSAPPTDGILEYLPNPPGTGELDSMLKLFNQAVILSPDQNTDTILDNVYAFEITAYDENNDEIKDYYSKDMPDYRAPARVDYRLVVLSDEDWLRRDTMSGSEWHEFAETQGEVFVVRAVIPMRERSP